MECQWKDCDQSFASIEELKKHLDTHANIELQCMWIGCARYEETQANKYALIAHMRKHSGDRPFKCTKCAKAYTRADALNKHMKTHKLMEKSLSDLACKIKYLQKEIENSEIKLEIMNYQIGLEMRRLRVVSDKCIEVVKQQILRSGKNNFQNSSFYKVFLGDENDDS